MLDLMLMLTTTESDTCVRGEELWLAVACCLPVMQASGAQEGKNQELNGLTSNPRDLQGVVLPGTCLLHPVQIA